MGTNETRLVEVTMLAALDAFKSEIAAMEASRVRAAIGAGLERVSLVLPVTVKAELVVKDEDGSGTAPVASRSTRVLNTLKSGAILRTVDALEKDYNDLKLLNAPAFEQAAEAVRRLHLPQTIKQGLVDCNSLYTVVGKWLEHLKKQRAWGAVKSLILFLTTLPWTADNSTRYDSNKRLFNDLTKLIADHAIEGNMESELAALLKKAKWEYRPPKVARSPALSPSLGRNRSPHLSVRMPSDVRPRRPEKRTTLRPEEIDRLHKRTRLTFADEQSKELNLVREINTRHTDRWKWENQLEDAQNAPDDVFEGDVTIEKQIFAKKSSQILQMRSLKSEAYWPVGGDVPLCQGCDILEAVPGECDTKCEPGHLMEIPPHNPGAFVVTAVPQEPLVAKSRVPRDGNIAKPKWTQLHDILSNLIDESVPKRDFDNLWRCMDTVQKEHV